MKAVILARVSTREQQEGHSIDAQVRLLHEDCKRNEWDVKKTFQIIESSTKGERREFMQLIRFIEEQPEQVVLVAAAVDRVQRSFKESVMLDELRRRDKVVLRFVREGLTLSNDSKSFEILQWDFAVMGAKSYVLNLSDNVKRSLEHKIKNGEWIAKAPLGYKNALDELTGKRTLVLDEDRSYLVRKGFELYSQGTYSVAGITRILVEDGLTNPVAPHGAITASSVHLMLRNPFYYGQMKIKGKLYSHKYEPIVDEMLWKRCQDVLNGWHKKPFKYAGKRFTFRGILRCAACGCAVSSDIKKGKYIYLRCTMSKRDCGAVRIREQILLKQVAKVLKGLEIPEDILEDMKDRLTESQKAKNDFHDLSLKSLRSKYDKVQRQLDRLLSMRLDESITKDQYDKKASELKQHQHELDLKQQQYTQADEDFSITVSYLLNISAQAHNLFEKAEPDERRQVLSFVFSNLELDGKKLQYQLKKPFDAVLTASKSQAWLRRSDSNRRHPR